MKTLSNAWNMYIFRDGKKELSGPSLVEQLSMHLRELGEGEGNSRAQLIDCLLRAGELECAMSDAGSPFAGRVMRVTDALAAALVSGADLDVVRLAATIGKVQAPLTVSVATPEGFAYYALHPLDYADLVREASLGGNVAVIGIRSIGTTLSAVAQAAVRARGLDPERITVRPTGHPYDREVNFDDRQLKWVCRWRERNAEFVIVDEGPGISGSSFLSVGEALVRCGVDRARITFFASRRPDPASLKAPDAVNRWPLFQALHVSSTRHLPQGAKKFIGGGTWRERAFEGEDRWPSSWLQMERVKFLSEDEKALYRFEGHGRFGQEVHDRASVVAQAGFGPMPLGREEGFGVYPMVSGRRLCSKDATPAVLTRVAEYCAFRGKNFQASSEVTPELEVMVRSNVREEFGVELPLGFSLECENSVICDGRMLPHKWIDTGDEILKVDLATHGDDHFFPGPVDISWDLAGVIVEWELDNEQQRYFLTRYEGTSGDSPKDRVAAYLIAYSVFRMAYCKMAGASMRGSGEEKRLLRDFDDYRRCAVRFLKAFGVRAVGGAVSVRVAAQ